MAPEAQKRIRSSDMDKKENEEGHTSNSRYRKSGADVHVAICVRAKIRAGKCSGL